MLKNLMFSFILLIISVNGFGQNVVSGRIIDQLTKEPIESAVISVVENGKTVITDSRGYFKIKLPADSGMINITMIGYHSKSFIINKIHSSSIIYLERGPLDLKEIIITPQSNSASFHTI